MKNLSVILFILLAISGNSQSVKRLHAKAVVADTHNDVLSSAMLDGIDISHRVKEGHSDLDRWKEGGVDIQFFSVWTGDKPRTEGGFYNDAIEEIDLLGKLILKNPERITLATNYKQVKKGLRQNKLVALIGVEGGHMIEEDLTKLQMLYDRGMRYLTLTWNNSISWASSAMDESGAGKTLKHKGLNEFGKSLVRHMNDLGLIIDLSHVGEQSFYDALAETRKPVFLSHSSVWAICPVFRNVKDEQIRAVAKNGGVICINFYSGFISREYDELSTYLNGPGKKIIMDSLYNVTKDSAQMKTQWSAYYNQSMNNVRPTLGQLVDHIDHIVKLVGDEYVGIGSDYDGVGSLPVGLEDVTTYPKITQELLNRGYSKRSIKKILGGNVLRVMKANFR